MDYRDFYLDGDKIKAEVLDYNPFEVTGYFHEEDEIMSEAYAIGSGSHAEYYIDKRRVSFDEWRQWHREHQRVGRKERDRYLDHLSEMYSLEYLTEEEFRERSEAASAAKFEADLTLLVTDLPPLPPTVTPALPPAIQEAYKTEVSKAVSKPRRHMSRTHKTALAWTLSLLATLGLMLPLDILAAGWYHGFGNAPFGYGVLTVLGGVWAFISLIFTICYGAE